MMPILTGCSGAAAAAPHDPLTASMSAAATANSRTSVCTGFTRELREPQPAPRSFATAGSGTLGGAEGYPRTHRLLLDRRGGATELLRNLPRRRARLRQSPEGIPFAGAPGSTVIRWTSCPVVTPQS